MRGCPVFQSGFIGADGRISPGGAVAVEIASVDAK